MPMLSDKTAFDCDVLAEIAFKPSDVSGTIGTAIPASMVAALDDYFPGDGEVTAFVQQVSPGRYMGRVAVTGMGIMSTSIAASKREINAWIAKLGVPDDLLKAVHVID